MATNSIETSPDGPDRATERLAYSVDEAAHLTGLSPGYPETCYMSR